MYFASEASFMNLFLSFTAPVSSTQEFFKALEDALENGYASNFVTTRSRPVHSLAVSPVEEGGDNKDDGMKNRAAEGKTFRGAKNRDKWLVPALLKDILCQREYRDLFRRFLDEYLYGQNLDFLAAIDLLEIVKVVSIWAWNPKKIYCLARLLPR